MKENEVYHKGKDQFNLRNSNLLIKNTKLRDGIKTNQFFAFCMLHRSDNPNSIRIGKYLGSGDKSGSEGGRTSGVFYWIIEGGEGYSATAAWFRLLSSYTTHKQILLPLRS